MLFLARSVFLLLAATAALTACSEKAEDTKAADEKPADPNVPAAPANPVPGEDKAPTPEAAVAAVNGDMAGAMAAASDAQPGAEKDAAAVRFGVVPASSAAFLIDAPLEKIKGQWNRFGGQLMVDFKDLNKTRGEVTMDLSTLRTTTFGDAGKDAKQTAHAINWMEIGSDVTADKRKQFATARFVIQSISGAGTGAGPHNVTAKGKLTLHGITLPQTVKLTITVEGPADAPTSVRIKTTEPMRVSLEGHDVKPRDLAGRFLAGALEKIGEKVTDQTQVSLDIQATRAGG